MVVLLGALFIKRSYATRMQAQESNEPVESIAFRLLNRGSRNPSAYSHDPRYVPWFACSSVANLFAHGPEQAAQATGETKEALGSLLLSAGYDLKRLQQATSVERMMYAMNATQELFSDITAKYGQQG